MEFWVGGFSLITLKIFPSALLGGFWEGGSNSYLSSSAREVFFAFGFLQDFFSIFAVLLLERDGLGVVSAACPCWVFSELPGMWSDVHALPQ